MARALRGVRGMRRSSARARALRLLQGSPLPRGLQRSRQPGCSCDARALNGGVVGVMAQVPEIVRSRSRARSAGRVETRHARCGVRTGLAGDGGWGRRACAASRSVPASCVHAQRSPSPQISAVRGYRARSWSISPNRGETRRSVGGEARGSSKNRCWLSARTFLASRAGYLDITGEERGPVHRPHLQLHFGPCFSP